MTAVGVASPIAHGHAMTSTATALVSAKSAAGSGPNAHHPMKVRAAMPRTIGTKIAATRSARRWIGAREPCASATSWTMRASAVSLADPRGAKDEASGAVDGAGEDLRIQRLFDREALARQHRLVDRRGALRDDPVDRDPLPRSNANEIPDPHVGRRHVDLGAVTHEARGARGEAHEPPDGFRRAPPGAGLEPSPEHDQRDDDRARRRSTASRRASGRRAARG